MSLLDEFGEELKEEGDDEQADVHAVNISIGGDDHLIITEGVEAVFDVECCLQQVELLVFVDYFLGQSEGIQWLASQREHSLGVHVTALGDAAAGGVTLGDEDGGFLLTVVLHIAEVDAAVA